MATQDPAPVMRHAEAFTSLMVLPDTDGPKPKAFDTYTRYSSAAGCSRQVALAATSAPITEPMDDASLWNVTLGTAIHEAWQSQVVRRLAPEGYQVELEAPSRHGDLTSGSADVVYEREDTPRTIVEGKSMGGWGFKNMIGAMNSPAEGPKLAHITQLALQVTALDAEIGRVAYFSKEAISPSVMDRYNLWDIMPTRAPFVEYEATAAELRPIAEKELERLAAIKSLAEEQGVLPRRYVPGSMPLGAEVTNAATGAWQLIDADGHATQVGSCWQCDYCDYQTLCHALGPGRVDISKIDTALDDVGVPAEPMATVTTVNFPSVGSATPAVGPGDDAA